MSTYVVLVTFYVALSRHPLVMIINSLLIFPTDIFSITHRPSASNCSSGPLMHFSLCFSLSYDSLMTQTFQIHQSCFFFPSTRCLVYDAPISYCSLFIDTPNNVIIWFVLVRSISYFCD